MYSWCNFGFFLIENVHPVFFALEEKKGWQDHCCPPKFPCLSCQWALYPTGSTVCSLHYQVLLRNTAFCCLITCKTQMLPSRFTTQLNSTNVGEFYCITSPTSLGQNFCCFQWFFCDTKGINFFCCWGLKRVFGTCIIHFILSVITLDQR